MSSSTLYNEIDQSKCKSGAKNRREDVLKKGAVIRAYVCPEIYDEQKGNECDVQFRAVMQMADCIFATAGRRYDSCGEVDI
jgi:hypothetical protein